MMEIYPSGPLRGTLQVASDKSISHRAVIFGSLATGTTRIQNLLEGEDVLCTIAILRELGVSIEKKGSAWVVKGCRGIFQAPSKILYCGYSGTTLRLLTGLLSGQSFTSLLTGDPSLNRRPMGRVIEPLTQMGASIHEEHRGEKRIVVVEGRKLKKGMFQIPVASAQLKTALLLAGLASSEPVSVREPFKSRDHTERMLKAFGARIQVKRVQVNLKPGGKLKGQKVRVPADFSSAAFFLVAALINPDPRTKIVLKSVGVNPTRTGALEVLKKMGARIQIVNRRTICGEPVADLVARPSKLKGTTISGALIPRLIDEIPILSVAAALAHGKTVIKDAAELRVKETDRIRSIVTELSKFGVSVKERPDGLEINGVSGKQ
ncbi:MAG: 3-phosphoshikimate 1-carboxyvinyltransferase, partial [Deltaproteobacteria bacterium]|nr:3-phosphoshikimate 1-carboxyvinyltransferase [Deltaproteobacteria bacterium]